MVFISLLVGAIVAYVILKLGRQLRGEWEQNRQPEQFHLGPRGSPHKVGEGKPINMWENTYQMLWNGYYPYYKTDSNRADADNYLKITMVSQHRGNIQAGGEHWTVSSYGPNILLGDNYDRSSRIFVEMKPHLLHNSDHLPRIMVRVTDAKTGDIVSYSSTDQNNLDGYTEKILLSTTPIVVND